MKAINEIYLNKEIIKQVRENFRQSEEIIVLTEFLKKRECEKIKKRARKLSGEKIIIPDKFSYFKICDKEVNEIFNSDEFLKFISGIITKGVKVKETSIRKFGHRDYTLLHDDSNTQEGYEFFFFISDNWSHSFGGCKVYVDTQGKKDSLIFIPENNKFCLIKCKNRRGFMKYVNHLAEDREIILVEGFVR